MSLSKDELIHELRSHYKELQVITEFYREGDESRGKVRYDLWIDSFKSFLRINLPEQAKVLDERKPVLFYPVINGIYPTPYESFMDIMDGRYLVHFIEMLISNVENGVIKVQKESKINIFIVIKKIWLTLISITLTLISIISLKLGYVSIKTASIIISAVIFVIFLYFITKMIKNHPKKIGLFLSFSILIIISIYMLSPIKDQNISTAFFAMMGTLGSIATLIDK